MKSTIIKKVKLTIVMDYSLAELKAKYRRHFGTPKSEKVTKKDICAWVACLVNADMLDV